MDRSWYGRYTFCFRRDKHTRFHPCCYSRSPEAPDLECTGTLRLFCHRVCVRLDTRRRPDSSLGRFPLGAEVLAYKPRRLLEETGEEKVVLASPFNLERKFQASDFVIFQEEHELQFSRTAEEPLDTPAAIETISEVQSAESLLTLYDLQGVLPHFVGPLG